MTIGGARPIVAVATPLSIAVVDVEEVRAGAGRDAVELCADCGVHFGALDLHWCHLKAVVSKRIPLWGLFTSAVVPLSTLKLGIALKPECARVEHLLQRVLS